MGADKAIALGFHVLTFERNHGTPKKFYLNIVSLQTFQNKTKLNSYQIIVYFVTNFQSSLQPTVIELVLTSFSLIP